MTLYKTLLDCFNTGRGVGLMSGITRHTRLEGRVKMAAQRELLPGGTLRRFYGVLCESMSWSGTPVVVTRKIEAALTLPEGVESRDVLRVLATYPQSVVTIARLEHDDERKKKKKEHEELEAEWQAVEDAAAKDKEEGNGLFTT